MRDLASIDLNLLVAVNVLLEERSVRGAARRLHVTPSAMSHTLRRIRALLGDEVFVRAGRGMVPTPRAEALVEPLRALLSQTQAVLADPAGFSPGLLRRAFRLVCTDYVSTVLLPTVERLLADEAPGVDLFVCPLSSNTMAEVRRGTVDVAVGVFETAAPEMRMRTLFEDRYVTVVRPDHPRIREPELTMDAFLAEQHVLVAPRGSPVGPIDALLAEQGLRRRVARTRPNFLAALWLVVDSDLLLTVSRRVVEVTSTRFPTRRLRPPLPVRASSLSMLWHPRVDAAVEDAWFRDVLVRSSWLVRPHQSPEGRTLGG